ncbi:nitroreductase family protein [Clostridium sp. D53t1_180928_C8]|uniref:nitroreductase family protein n=1 Tax=Clostridium sp. D53t1_180928_C8 TaxID=2787101 RepID=UPI0018AAA449|nr:nitroreductase family protein [Clostridium sp. D53t1_180928_C8]
MKSLDFIYNRKSIRKFKSEEVSREDIIKMLDAAIHAPSPKNQQTWHFVVIQNNELISKISDIVEKNHINLAEMAKEEKQRKLMMNLLSYYTCFKNAPVLVVVYSKEYYMVEETILKDNNASEEVLSELRFPNSAAQGIGAAVENFLLAATELGYGTCYMTGPTHSKVEIEELINFEKEGYKLMSMIALGVAEEDTPNSPPRKTLEEVVTFID